MNQKILNYDTFDFANSVVIKPDESGVDENKKMNVKYTKIVIDSRDRNTNIYPNPSSYTINLEEIIDDIFIAELLIANVPFSEHVVCDSNNIMKFIVDNIYEVNVKITNRNYDETQLAEEFTSVLNSNQTSINNSLTFNVIYNKFTNKYTFTCNLPFVIIASDRVEKDYNGNDENKYTTNSTSKLLGFGKEKYYSNFDIVHSIEAPFVRNFNDSNYIALHIDQFSVNKSISSVTNKSFAILSKAYTLQSFISAGAYVKKFFPQPIAKLSKLTIKLYDVDGNLYNFQNKDHRLELMLHSYKHTRAYNSYIVGT